MILVCVTVAWQGNEPPQAAVDELPSALALVCSLWRSACEVSDGPPSGGVPCVERGQGPGAGLSRSEEYGAVAVQEKGGCGFSGGRGGAEVLRSWMWRCANGKGGFVVGCAGEQGVWKWGECFTGICGKY